MSEAPDLTEGGKKPHLWQERREEYDPGPLLIRSGVIFVGVLIAFIAAIIVLQIWKSPEGRANTESWAALTGLVGWATSQVSIIFSNRFGTTQQAAKKDEVIARQASAVMANAAAKDPVPKPIVTPAEPDPKTGIVPAAEAVQTKDGVK